MNPMKTKQSIHEKLFEALPISNEAKYSMLKQIRDEKQVFRQINKKQNK
jgi:hypothetical protein